MKRAHNDWGIRLSAQENYQSYYNEFGGIRQMEEKYLVDWNAIDETEAPTLLDAVARYVSSTAYPKIEDILAILCIKRVDQEDGE